MTTAPIRRRPRDRRDQLIRSASRLFRASGYHNVGITDIAAAEGITSGALYRHFSNKDDLLRATIEAAVSRGSAMCAEPGTAKEIVERLAMGAIEHPEDTVLWARELRHLPPKEQLDLRDLLLKAVRPLHEAIAAERPELSSNDVSLLVWACLGALGATASRGVPWDTAPVAEELRATLARCLDAKITVTTEAPEVTTSPGRPGLLPSSRSEAILAAATHLFVTRGFAEVGVDDIGAAAGITGATVYHHFPSKTTILLTAIDRAISHLMFDLGGILARSRGPREALRRLLDSYVQMGVDHGPALGALLAELPALEKDRRRVSAQMVDLVEEWVALGCAAAPEVDVASVRVRVMTAMSLVNALCTVPRVVDRPTAFTDIHAVASIALGSLVQ